jgi:hypothetical protein
VWVTAAQGHWINLPAIASMERSSIGRGMLLDILAKAAEACLLRRLRILEIVLGLEKRIRQRVDPASTNT